MKSKSLNLEALELREVPAGSITPGIFFDAPSGTLTIVGTEKGDVIDARPAGNLPGTVQATLNDQVQVFSGVTNLVALGQGGSDDINFFNSSLPDLIDGGAGDDMIQASTGNSTVLTGKGSNTVYDILGTNFLAADGNKNRLYTNAASNVLSDANDLVFTFFGPGRTPGSNSVQLLGGILYLTPGNQGTTTQLFEQGKNVLLVSDWAGVQSFSKKDVQGIAYFGGSGDDVYANNTSVEEVVYGGVANGADSLTSGFGDFAFMKGGGGPDNLVGRAADGDYAGNSGVNTLVSLGGPAKFRYALGVDLVFLQKKDQSFLP